MREDEADDGPEATAPTLGSERRCCSSEKFSLSILAPSSGVKSEPGAILSQGKGSKAFSRADRREDGQSTA